MSAERQYKPRHHCSTVQLGWLMVEESVREAGMYSESFHLCQALAWAEGYEEAKGQFHAEQLAALKVKELLIKNPWMQKSLDALLNPKAPPPEKALYGPEPKL